MDVAALPHVDEDLQGARRAHERLRATLFTVDDAAAARCALVPDWTVGHVLTHLARNADSHRRALDGALRGEVVDRYPGGAEQRRAEIEAGAHRPAAEVVGDVRSSIELLEQTWAVMTPAAWARPGRSMGRAEPVAGLAFQRWREVEVHQVDLGLDLTWRDWPGDYVRRELRLASIAWRASHPMGQTELPAAALALQPQERLAWLLGRVQIAGLAPVRQWW